MTKTITFSQGLQLDCGVALAPVELAYRSYGTLNRRGDNAILVAHALSGSASLEEWWPALVGPGKALDPSVHFIVCVNLLGSCYGSSGPLSENPATSRPYQADFPRVSIADQVRAQKLLIDALGIRQLQAVLGPSLGGMIALQWALLYPECVASLVLIATTAAHSAQAIAQSALQRRAIALDPDFAGGYYTLPPVHGLALARQLAHVGYRSRESLAQRFGRKQTDGRYDVVAYLEHQGNKFCARFDANSYIRLSECMNGHSVSDAELHSITQPALVLSIDSDELYPVSEQAHLAAHIPRAQHVIVHSVHGHDGFLLEAEAVGGAIERFLFPTLAAPARVTQQRGIAQ